MEVESAQQKNVFSNHKPCNLKDQVLIQLLVDSALMSGNANTPKKLTEGTSMNQFKLFEEKDYKSPKDRWVLISLQPEYYNQLCAGMKQYQYRRGGFLKEPAKAFVYCSAPNKEIGALVQLGQPLHGTPDKIARIKEREVPGSYGMMIEWMNTYNQASATPIEKVETFSPISLHELKSNFPKFHPPQRFIYLDKTPEVLHFIQEKSGLRL